MKKGAASTKDWCADLNGENLFRKIAHSLSFEVVLTLYGTLILTWILFVTGTSTWFYSASNPPKAFFDTIAVFTLVFALVQMACAFISRKINSLLRSSIAITLFCLMLFCGTIFLFFAVWNNEESLFWVMVPGVFLGAIGFVYSQAFFVKMLSSLERESILLIVGLSFLFACFLNLAFNALLVMVSVVVILFVPILMLPTALFMQERGSQKKVDLCLPTPICLKSVMHIIILLFGVFCFGLSVQFIRASGWSTENINSVSGSLTFHIMGIAIAGVITCGLLLILRKKEHIIIGGIARTSIPIIIAAGILLPTLFQEAPIRIANLVVGTGIGLFEILVFFYSAVVTKRKKISSFATIGFPWCVLGLASLVGQLARRFLEHSEFIGQMQWLQISTIVIFALFSVSIFCLVPIDRKVSSVLVEECEDLQWHSRNRKTTQTEEKLISLKDSSQNGLEQRFHESGFTKREVEVALLLAKGRSLPFIQEELCISRGTANTHVVHIYKKLGIHNRQEFFDLLEQ